MKKLFLLITIPVFLASYSNAQNRNTRAQETDEGYKFTPVIDLKTTSVKNQAATGTCWCFATTSFIETELLRMGKGEDRKSVV